MEYNEDDFLQISGIQHFLFCRRQFSLIYIEGIWKDNVHTVKGNILHENVHDESFEESRSQWYKVGAMKIHSYYLGISGECDIVEFHQDNNGIEIYGKEGKWILFPVEYKKGKPKNDLSDVAQLCLQAFCLEEMFSCKIEYGYLYYIGIHRRTKVEFTEKLREEIKNYLNEMRVLYDKRYTPKVKKKSKCNSCSIKEYCITNDNNKSVSKYIEGFI